MTQSSSTTGLAGGSPNYREHHLVDPGSNGLSLDTFKAMAKAFVVGFLAYLIGYFNLSLSWLVLGSVAYAVRYHLRQQMKAKASLRKLVLDKKNISMLLEDLPSWVYFPDTERCEWLNKMLGQLWPFIGQYVQEMLVEVVEPSLRASLPSYLQSFKFETIDLGDILVDFTLTNVGEIMEIPGVNDLLKKAVTDQISQVLVLPNKYTYRVIESVSAHTLKYSLPSGVLRIQVIEAAKLVKADIGMLGMGKSDPYVVLTVGKTEFRTQVIPSTITPRWDFSCEAVVHQLPGSVLDIEVYDEDQSSKDDFLGRTALSIPDLAEKCTADMWLKLEAVKSGQIHIRTEWVTLSANPADLERELEYKRSLTSNHQHSLGLIAVFLDCASALPRVTQFQSDPDTPVTTSDDERQLRGEGCGLENNDGLIWHMFAPFKNLAIDFKRALQDHVSPVSKVGSKAAEPSCQVVLSVDKEERRSTIVANSINPVWEETFSFLCANPDIGEVNARVLDTKSGQCVGSASVSTARLLKEGDMRLDEPLALKGTNNAKLMLTLQLRILQSSGNLVGGGNRSTTPGYSRSSSGQHGDYPPSGEGGSVVSTQGPSTHTFGSGIVPLSQSGMPSTPRKTELPSMDEMVHSTISPILETFHGSRTSLQRPTLSPSLGGLGSSSTWNTQMRVTLRYSPPRNRLVCVIHQVKDLPPPVVASDEEEVYVKVQLSPCDTVKHKENWHKTRPIRVNSSGIIDFDETLELDVAAHELALVSLQLQLRCRSTKRASVFNMNKRIINLNHNNAKRKLLGQLILSLDQLNGVTALTEWYFLSPA
ncbi:extended synaptotagmin-2-like isoform X6 [Varroa jacobsoni]|uniref:C2 domain-containing protein n=1 Tax=Varroa destructor TaxID=109461 RepID=A0A7M7IYK6_VARDE|nr:extended synaptotagmin-2-like isoform X7 [Varroa destructor]XP_022687911.1 extended synaptotagmin-2-like isoform X6 [Varroa jacobsoni]